MEPKHPRKSSTFRYTCRYHSRQCLGINCLVVGQSGVGQHTPTPPSHQTFVPSHHTRFPLSLHSCGATSPRPPPVLYYPQPQPGIRSPPPISSAPPLVFFPGVEARVQESGRERRAVATAWGARGLREFKVDRARQKATRPSSVKRAIAKDKTCALGVAEFVSLPE